MTTKPMTLDVDPTVRRYPRTTWQAFPRSVEGSSAGTRPARRARIWGPNGAGWWLLGALLFVYLGWAALHATAP